MDKNQINGALGYHKKAGGAHAEINALRQANRNAKGADLYVTLEPCCHHGKTAPCSEALINSGVRRVFVGSKDPNPKVNGKGIRQLRKAGIEVSSNILKQECHNLIEDFSHCLKTGRPQITCKVAISLDGKLATSSGQSQWISNAKTRGFVHKLRDQLDGIMIGAGTLRADNPRLTVRTTNKERFTKVVIVDSGLSFSARHKLWQRRAGEVIVACTAKASQAKRAKVTRQGHEVLVCRADKLGRVSMNELMKKLASKGFCSLLVEGGSELFGSLLKQNYVDRVVACVAPVVIGDKGKSFINGFNANNLAKAPRLSNVAFHTFDGDVIIEGSMSAS